MTKVETISNGYNIPETFGKRITNKDLHPYVQTFIQEQLTKNPNITDTELQPLVSNYIDTITNGKKIGSAKKIEMSSLSETIKISKQNLAHKTPVVVQRTPVTAIPSEILRANSRMPLQTTRKKENIPNQESPKEEYISSKKKKLLKKEKELQAKVDKQKTRRIQGKAGRNAVLVQEQARHTTANNQIMSREAERIYKKINKIQNPRFKDARESAKVFVKNGYAPISPAKVSAEVFIQNGQTWAEKAFDLTEQLLTNAEKDMKQKIKELINNIPTAEVKESIKEVVKEVPKEKIVEKEVVKEIVKEVPKNNKWAIVGAAVVGGLLTWVGTKIPAKKQSA